MILIVGLGNPGGKYENTRHNMGFRIIEKFQEENGFPDFKFSKKFNAEISEKIFGREKIILAKPQTFMNSSGQAVKKLMTYNKLETTGLLVIHDDIDLPLGSLRISKESGAGGHKGVDSIIEHLSSKNFIRFRIGILPEKGKPKNVERFVLQNFTKEEEKILPGTISRMIEAIKAYLKEGLEKTMNDFNK